MANALYDKGRQRFLEGAISAGADTIKAVLVKSSYTPDLAAHDFYDDISAHVSGTPQALANKTTTNGVFDADDATFTAVTNGDAIAYIAVFKDTGTAGTSPLIALIDDATGLPFTGSGGNVLIAWDNGADKIFRL